MRSKPLLATCTVVLAGLAVGAPAEAKPPASPNASCVGQSVSAFVPFSPIPFGELVRVSAQTAEPNSGLAFVKPEATAAHDECAG